MLDQLFEKLPYEQLQKIKFAHLLMGAFGVGLLLIGIYYFTIYSAGEEEFVALVTKKGQVEKKLKDNELLVAQTGSIAKGLATRVQNLVQIKRQMPSEKDLPQLLRRVGDSENELGLQIMLFEVEEGKVNDYYKEIPIRIQVRGGYWNAAGFFDKLQDLLQIVNFSELKMESRKEKKTAPKGRGKEDLDVKLMSELSVEKTGVYTDVRAKAYAYLDGAEDRAAPSPPPPPAPPAAAPNPAGSK